MNLNHLQYLLILILLVYSCKTKPDANLQDYKRLPELQPDYADISLPLNIAPMNFFIVEKGNQFYIEVVGKKGTPVNVTSNDGVIRFPLKKWKKLLIQNKNDTLTYTIYSKEEGKWFRFSKFTQFVSPDSIDAFLYYRLLYPGYESWTEISIVQRHLESFKERTVVENNVLEQNCVNCHSFNAQNNTDFLFHVRGSLGGTYFQKNGKLEKVNLKTDEMENGAVYPRWHPSGRYVAFSSNKVVQQFHASALKKIEVSDLNSSLVLYDREKNEIMDIPVDLKHLYMDTYPEWSPDGRMLYFCRARQIEEGYDYRAIHYDLCRISFDSVNRAFGKVDTVFEASLQNKSVSFPRIAPDGKTLVFTMHDYGCFPIWHKEADLYAINLSDLTVKAIPVNSEFTESYHSWSSSGRWLLFSSKRGDGLSARPYMAYVARNGEMGKPFVLPQKDPLFYSRFIKTFNIPEFATAAVSFTPGQLKNAAKSKPVQVNWAQQ